MSEPLVTVEQGTLLGKELKSEKNNLYHSYTGIPYAKAPVGDLRFKPPQAPGPWSGVRDATREGIACRSFHLFNKTKIGDEDCLFLNVYVPKTSNKTLPVMFWIHGGGFYMGSGNSDIYGPDYLMDHAVILVTINYRLGVLGFLNLEIEDAPGNVGLRDQVAALKWVKNNIAKFGGNPDNITIFGESAGGASVNYLILSDLARGLFHKAIAQSGNALNPWAIESDPIKQAFQLCKVLGHSTKNKEEALQFLRQIPVDQLIDAKLPKEDEGQLINEHPFLPTVEKRFANFEPFLNELPISKMKSGNFNKVPFMCGYNSAEGILALMDFSNDTNIFDKFEADFERFVPRDLNLSLRSNGSVNLSKDMRKLYYGDESVTADNKEKFVTIFGDIWFLRGIVNSAKYIMTHSTKPVYLYKYTFDDFGFIKKLVLDPQIKGAAHGDELGYIFKFSPVDFPNDMQSAIENRERLLLLWTNFAKSGNPTPEINKLIPIKWEQATLSDQKYFEIGNSLEMVTDPDNNRLKFWDQYT